MYLFAAGISEANVDRRERLRKLALETIDLAKVRGRVIGLLESPSLNKGIYHRTHTSCALTWARSSADYA